MAEHLSSQELERYVRDLLPEQEAAQLEEHAASCPACAERLAQEARLEMQLVEVAEQAEPQAPARSRRWALAALLAAAAVALLLSWPALRDGGRDDEMARATSGAPSMTPSAAGMTPSAAPKPVCVTQPERCNRAPRHGLVKARHPNPRDIPRYEEMAPQPMAADPPRRRAAGAGGGLL